MDTFKVEFFNRDYPDKHFPWFEELTVEEANHIRDTLVAHLPANMVDSPNKLFGELLNKSTPISDVDVESPDFDLGSCLAYLNIKPTFYSYINWKQFDDIDRFKSDDLIIYFDDICAGYLSDDVCVFDDTLDWLLFIMHYGGIRIVKFGSYH